MSRITVRIASSAHRQSWDAYVENNSTALAYHRWAWLAAVNQAYNFDYIGFMALDGEKVNGILPCVVLKLPHGQRLLSSLPYCDVGGPVADDMETCKALIEAGKDFASDNGIKRFEIRLLPNEKALFPGHLAGSQKVRMVLPLPSGSEQLMNSFKSKVRSQVRKPMRDGLTSRIGGLELLEIFWKIYARNMRDLGSLPHPLSWFKAVVESYGPLATVAVSYLPNGEPAAAGITLRNGRIVSIPWASSIRKYNRQNPNMLLYWTLLAHAADTGAEYFDFGRSTRGEGTYRFKAQWGAQEVPVHWLEWDGNVWVERETIYKKGLLRSVAEDVLSRAPLTVNTSMGRYFRKYISL